MKNYSSNRAQKGKTAYRTPSRFKVKQSLYNKIKGKLEIKRNWTEIRGD